jgi:glycosyltransferase involved in cell wall biosynthesis
MSNKTNRLKIFVSAYACEPNLGSEIGVGWHWVLEMSKYFELWVLTRKSNQLGIEAWLEENPSYKNIHFIYFDLPYYLRFWKKGMRGVRTYYNIWQWVTNSIVKETMQSQNIKIFHHLTYGNVLWSVSNYGQQQFFIWGPVGGLETIASEFSKEYHFKGRIIEALRRIVVKSLPINIGFQKRCKNANLILCKTDILKNSIPNKYKNKAFLFTDVAVDSLTFERSDIKKENEKIQLIAVGRLDPWRGFDLLIEAIALAVKTNLNIHLEIVGKGLDYIRLQNLIKKHNLSNNVGLVGEVSREVYYQKMANCDVVVNPSLKEGAVTISFDSMSFAKPLICVDTTGYTRYFSEEYAIVIPLQKRMELIKAVSNAVLRLANPQEREKLGANAKIAGKQFSWEARGFEIYQTILNSYEASKNVCLNA